MAEKARDLFGKCIAYAATPGLLEPKFTDTRPAKGIGVPMIMINTAQANGYLLSGPGIETRIDFTKAVATGQCISGILDRKAHSRAGNAVTAKLAA